MTISAPFLCDLVALVLLAGLGLMIIANQSFEKTLNHFFLFFIVINTVLAITSMLDPTIITSVCAYVSSIGFALAMFYKLSRNREMLNPYEVPVVVFVLATVVIVDLFSVFVAQSERCALILSASVVSGFICYMYLYAEIFKHDQLTGLLTRRSLYADLSVLSGQKIAVVSCDLNDLKGINDRGGHKDGDQALRTLANVCLSAGQRAFRIYRVGGDEFIALGPNRTREEARKFIRLAKSKLAHTPYSASFGHATYSPEQNIDDVLNRADARMYDDKHEFHFRSRLRDD